MQRVGRSRSKHLTAMVLPGLCGLILGLCVGSVGGEIQIPEVDVYHMVQYDAGGQHYGSQKSGVNMLAVGVDDGDVARKVVVLEFGEVTEKLVNDLISQRAVGAMLIILPESFDKVSDEDLIAWRSVEMVLLTREIPIPVYFAFDSEHASVLRSRVQQKAANTHLVIPADGSTSRALNVQSTNFQGFLAGGSTDDTPPENLKTIAIVAYYDSLGVAPGVSVGADANGSGMVALLELARLYNKLYNGARTRGKYNLLFVLTGAGRLNFQGAKHWLSQTDSRLLDNIEFALCLDTIGAGDKLFLHTSKPLAKDATLNKIYSTLTEIAEEMDVKVQLVHKKINISDPYVAWEHEQFSRKRVLAGTLSRLSTTDAVQRNNILDRAVDTDVLQRNILLVANTLARHIFGLTGKHEIFSGSTGVQSTFIEAWSQGLAREPRLAYQEPSPLIAKAEEVLKTACSETSRTTFTLDGDRVFYKGKMSAKMSVYSVRPFSFYVMMMVCVICYLLALLIALQGPTEAGNTLKQIFTSPNIRKHTKRA